MRLIYSEQAAADLVRLRAFIAEHDPHAAAQVAAELLSRIEHIQLFPELGRKVEHAPEPQSVRDAVFGKYIVRYTAHSEAIVILRSWPRYESR